jgi:hypothetical protein
LNDVEKETFQTPTTTALGIDPTLNNNYLLAARHVFGQEVAGQRSMLSRQ